MSKKKSQKLSQNPQWLKKLKTGLPISSRATTIDLPKGNIKMGDRGKK